MTDVDFLNRVRVFNRITDDIRGELRSQARFIGELVPNDTRLSVKAALTGNDRNDHFSFRTTATNTKPEIIVVGEQVRFRLLRQNGSVIADSAGNGVEKENYDKLTGGQLDLGRGQYTVQISRAPGSSESENRVYFLQLKAGKTIRRDFDTQERPAPRSQTINPLFATSSASLSYDTIIQGLDNFDNAIARRRTRAGLFV